MIDFEVDTFGVSKMVIAVHSISYHVINSVLIIQDTGHSPPPYALSENNTDDKFHYKMEIVRDNLLPNHLKLPSRFHFS